MAVVTAHPPAPRALSPGSRLSPVRLSRAAGALACLAVASGLACATACAGRAPLPDDPDQRAAAPRDVRPARRPPPRSRWRAELPAPEDAGPAPATTDAYFVGDWEAVDDDAWIYHLEVFDDMRYTERIDRPNGEECVQHGRIWVEGSELYWYYDVNTCNTAYEGQSDPDDIIDAERDAFTIDLDDYTLTYKRLGAGLDG